VGREEGFARGKGKERGDKRGRLKRERGRDEEKKIRDGGWERKRADLYISVRFRKEEGRKLRMAVGRHRGLEIGPKTKSSSPPLPSRN
jgi:hypothetical protein